MLGSVQRRNKKQLRQQSHLVLDLNSNLHFKPKWILSEYFLEMWRFVAWSIIFVWQWSISVSFSCLSLRISLTELSLHSRKLSRSSEASTSSLSVSAWLRPRHCMWIYLCKRHHFHVHIYRFWNISQSIKTCSTICVFEFSVKLWLSSRTSVQIFHFKTTCGSSRLWTVACCIFLRDVSHRSKH